MKYSLHCEGKVSNIRDRDQKNKMRRMSQQYTSIRGVLIAPKLNSTQKEYRIEVWGTRDIIMKWISFWHGSDRPIEFLEWPRLSCPSVNDLKREGGTARYPPSFHKRNTHPSSGKNHSVRRPKKKKWEGEERADQVVVLPLILISPRSYVRIWAKTRSQSAKARELAGGTACVANWPAVRSRPLI